MYDLRKGLAKAKAAIGQWVRSVFWIKENYADLSDNDDGYNRTKDLKLNNRFILGPDGLVLSGLREVDRLATTLHRGVCLRTPTLFWVGMQKFLGQYQSIPKALLGIHPYCGREYNHYHFILDVLPRILAGEKEGFGSQYPYLVNSHVARSKPFRFFLSQTSGRFNNFLVLQSLNRVKDLRVLNRPGFEIEKFKEIRKIMGIAPCENPFRKIFLKRAPHLRRPLLNQDEIEEKLKLFDFESVDFGQLSFEDQIKLATETRYLIAIHGAGMVNTIFHKSGDLTVLELRPDTMRYQFFFKNIAESCRHEFSILPGKSTEEGAFEISFEEVEGAISTWGIQRIAL